MLDQSALIERVVARLERAGMTLHSLPPGALLAVIDCVAFELIAEAPTSPKDLPT